MKRSTLLFLTFFGLAAGCGGVPAEDDSFKGEDVDLLTAGDLAPDIAIGEPIDDPDALAANDLCLDEDECNDTLVVAPDANALEQLDSLPRTEPALDVARTIQTHAASDPVVSSQMIVATYAAFRRTPSVNAPRYDVAPQGGVHADALHPVRNPRGYIPPGQTVTLVDPRVVNGFSKVRYERVTGWVSRSRLIWLDPRVSRLELALRPAVRNAFFKHQLLRSKWNKDGPLTSGNCAPTSLAMAAHVFGAEPAGLSVEESVHQVRAKYDPGLHERSGSTRADIELAARRLHLEVQPLRTDLPPALGLRRIDHQLALGRAVVLIGMPGKPGAGPTLYERAFARAFAAAIRSGEQLRHPTYNFDGGHSIVVLGRDSSGRYVVGDPISEIGFLAIEAAELKDFITRFAGNRGTGNAVWR